MSTVSRCSFSAASAIGAIATARAPAPIARVLASEGTFQSGVEPRPIALIATTVVAAVPVPIVWSQATDRWVGTIILADRLSGSKKPVA